MRLFLSFPREKRGGTESICLPLLIVQKPQRDRKELSPETIGGGRGGKKYGSTRDDMLSAVPGKR